MGVGDWFQTFCGNIRIGTEKRSSIGYRTGRIVGQLNADLRGLDSKTSYRFYVGSYGRSTAIPSVSDVDLLYELPNELYARFNGHAGNGQSALLAHVRASIQKTYSVTEIGGDGQVVVLRFDDGVKFGSYSDLGAVIFQYELAARLISGRDWLDEHKEELLKDWELAQKGEPLTKISPLI